MLPPLLGPLQVTRDVGSAALGSAVGEMRRKGSVKWAVLLWVGTGFKGTGGAEKKVNV